MVETGTTMLPFFRQEPDGSETCFQVELAGALSRKQAAKLQASLAGFFKYLPTHRVTTATVLNGNVGMVGPRLAIETPFSSSAVEILQAAGFPEALRVEAFRRHVVAGRVSREAFLTGLYDPVVECIHEVAPPTFLVEADIPPVEVIPILEQGIEVLRQFCGPTKEGGQNLGFNDLQLTHIMRIFQGLGKNPTDVALFQLAQMWSDHCRHLLFNAKLTIDGVELPYTLFDLLRSPYQSIKGGPTDNVLIGFFDNASAIRGYTVPLLVPSRPGSPCPYVIQEVNLHHILSGETHNYPVHVFPYHGATTEILGEIRDQLGVGCGSDILYAGCGRVVGSLWFPNGYRIPGEILSDRLERYTYPADKAKPIDIVRGGLAGWHFAADCFGKPCTYGFFYSGAVWRPRRNADGEIVFERIESLKPVSFGVSGGTIRQEHLKKGEPLRGMKIIRIGGSALPVGFCGGSGSSSISGSNVAAFDENAVQRGNPEMERRDYEVLLTFVAMGEQSPIVAIHDQGAGGIANVLTELIEKSGGRLYLGAVRRGDPTMPDVKVWVCEFQEGMGFLCWADRVEEVQAVCQRENCPCEVVGEVTGDGQLVVYSEASQAEVEAKAATPIIELDLAQVLKDMPPIELRDETPEDVRVPLELPVGLTVEQAVRLVFRRSEVGSKEWAIRTVDGSVGGQVVHNQRCGPFGLPVNDCSLVALSQNSFAAQAASLGVMPYKTTLCPPAGGRMAIGEMITNLMGVRVENFESIQSICNWMWPANIKPADGELARLVVTAKAIKEALQELLIAIIGGKDSSSLATKVHDLLVKSIETVVFSSVAPVPDFRYHVTPEIKRPGESVLIQIDIANGQRRLGGSSLGQCFGQLGSDCPDLDDPALLKRAFNAGQEMLAQGLITAGHDISDGGLLTTVAEMCFAAGCGMALDLPSNKPVLAECFAEELGYVVECSEDNTKRINSLLRDNDVPYHNLGFTLLGRSIQVVHDGAVVLEGDTDKLRRDWERTGHELRKLLMNPQVAIRERRNTARLQRPKYRLSFTPQAPPPAVLASANQHRVLVVREQGSNGHPEMIESFKRAGFETWCAHMNDLRAGQFANFNQFRGLIFPGGFSYGDVLGAGVGWAMKILLDPKLKQMFDEFFARDNTFSLGICNGAQLGLRCGWAPLPDLPPDQQPRFTLNRSGSFQHQWIQLKVTKSPAIMLRGMAGSILGAWVANAEGRFNCDHAPQVLDCVVSEGLVSVVYVDPKGRQTTTPPYSPSGSFVAGVCDPTGRHLYMMPHTFDRGSLMYQWQWVPPEWEDLEVSPWAQMGHNARVWCDAS